VVDFEPFRPELERAVPRADRSKGGRPPFDHVLMFKVLILQTQNNLSDERCEFYLRDRLTWMRFLGLGLGDPVPDANTIWTFREALTRAGAIARLFERFDLELRAAGYLAMSGQLVDATIVSAPKQRNTKAEKQAIKEGRIPEDWQQQPAKLQQKDRDARWTVQTTKAKSREGETPMVDLAIPEFGYQNHVSTDRRHRLIRKWRVTDAAAYAGAYLADLLDPDNTAAGVWADTAYRSRKNEGLLRQRMLTSHIHRKKPAHLPMPRHVARGNAKKSAVRAHVEHVFAEQKVRMGLFVRTIGLARATTKIGLANLTYNMRRLLWLARQTAVA
jgi:IS5 family transposase